MPFSHTSVIEIIVQGRSATGQQVVNVFHYRDALAEAQAYDNIDLQEAVSDFNAAWSVNIEPLLSIQYKVENFRGRALTGVQVNPTPPPATELIIGEQHDQPGIASNVGERAGTEASSFLAVGAQKLTDRSGRNFRGQFRIGTLSEADVFGNSFTAVYAALLQPALDLFALTPLTLGFDAINWRMCVFSRTLALAAPPPFTDLRALTAGVTGTRLNNFVTSQVSRKQSLTKTT